MKPELYTPFELFTKHECEEIIQRARQQEISTGTTRQGIVDRRTNSTTWLDWDDTDIFYYYLTGRDDIEATWLYTPFQISRYLPGEFYDWHKDVLEQNKRSSVRTITLTCTLQTAPGAVFKTRDKTFDLAQGQALLFPADVEHTATAPTSGERWAFTIWAMKPNPDKS